MYRYDCLMPIRDMIGKSALAAHAVAVGAPLGLLWLLSRKSRGLGDYPMPSQNPKARGMRIAEPRGATRATVCTKTAGRGKNAIDVCVTRPRKTTGPLRNPGDACRMLRKTASYDRETFHVILLDAGLRVIGIEEAHRGTLLGVEVHPREVFKSAIQSNAASLVLAHNHPSGSSTPSREDLVLTERLAEAGQLLGIPVVDALVVADDGCRSLMTDEVW